MNWAPDFFNLPSPVVTASTVGIQPSTTKVFVPELLSPLQTSSKPRLLLSLTFLDQILQIEETLVDTSSASAGLVKNWTLRTAWERVDVVGVQKLREVDHEGFVYRHYSSGLRRGVMVIRMYSNTKGRAGNWNENSTYIIKELVI